jgi:uncharacterized cupredoxin-like copper-binding protein
MKKIETAVMASLLALVFGFTPLSIYAHGSNHQEEMEFDPVDNEFGSYAPKLQITRTIKVELTDQMRFTPDMIKVKKGDVIKFEHTNTGQIMHEFVLGTPATLDEHAKMMKKFPGMEHSEPYMAHVPPGESKAIIWQFSKAGEFAFGCLIPGHYDAGMKGKILVGS